MPEAGAPECARNNLEELGMDAMASSAAEYAALVASGAKTFPRALMEMIDAKATSAHQAAYFRCPKSFALRPKPENSPFSYSLRPKRQSTTTRITK